MSEQMEILARGVGRRKEAIAQVHIVPGTGQFLINGIPATTYLQQNPRSILSIDAPIKLFRPEPALDGSSLEKMSPLGSISDKEQPTTFNNDSFDTIVKVRGGGLVGQADAIKLGVAIALCQFKEEYRKSLKDKGYLTQDARVKERRKYGLKKARKASQYHKR
nr:ribosomal protein S9 [Chaetopeltis orbicularis]